MGGRITLKVLTPDRVVLETAADSVVLRAWGGDMGILPGHEPCVAALDYGPLRVFEGERESAVLAVMGGFATVREDAVTVMTFLAEPPDRLEEALRALDRDRAENLVREQRYQAELQRAESALRRNLLGQDIGARLLTEEQPAGEDENGKR